VSAVAFDIAARRPLDISIQKHHQTLANSQLNFIVSLVWLCAMTLMTLLCTAAVNQSGDAAKCCAQINCWLHALQSISADLMIGLLIKRTYSETIWLEQKTGYASSEKTAVVHH
jgi:hypothetical protein